MSNHMKQDWFEMHEVRRRRLANAVWIPLRAAQRDHSAAQYGRCGYKEEFFGAGSLAVPLEKKYKAERLGWAEIGIAHEHGARIQDGRYIPADIFEDYEGDLIGVALVLEQRGNREEPLQWHLHHDFVIALGLKREGDVWVSINEGYREVVRLRRRGDGRASLLEVRAEHLKDYLCARNMALYVTSYKSRVEIVDDANHMNWLDNPVRVVNGTDLWEGRITEIHEGGYSFGSSIAVLHMSRTDVDPAEDVPQMGLPSADNVASESWTINPQGRKLHRIQGEFWRNEWVDPGEHSTRIREDKLPPTVFFITDAAGSRQSGESLKGEGRWLWFRPEVIMVLARRRGGALQWHTRDTGSVSCSPDYNVHFGVNKLGLITVYAKDIAFLPEWQQALWAGFNLSPEGGVSEELLASQVKAEPAKTQAPEEFLPLGIGLLNQVALEKFGFPIFREHKQFATLLSRTHRFRSVDEAGFFPLLS